MKSRLDNKEDPRSALEILIDIVGLVDVILPDVIATVLSVLLSPALSLLDPASNHCSHSTFLPAFHHGNEGVVAALRHLLPLLEKIQHDVVAVVDNGTLLLFQW